MSTDLTLGHLTAAPGSTIKGLLPQQIKGISFDLPIYLINGKEEGPTLVVTAGIHGSEYPCVEAATRLGREIDPTVLRGQVIIVPSANPVAFKARSIYITPPDGLNLNRQFPGDPEGTFTRAWADWLFQHVMSKADMYIDMHGGDMIEALIPFVAWNRTGNENADRIAHEMANAYGIRATIVKDSAGDLGGTTTASAARAGIPALLTEAGGQGVWKESEVDILQSGVRRVMSHFKMYAAIDDAGEQSVELGGWEWLRSSVDGLFYPAVEIGEMVEEGQLVGRITDIFGEVLQEAYAPVSGEVLFLVTSLAMNDGDPLMSIAFA